MPDLDLAVSVRNYARGKGRASVVVSSAWLAREFDVDPRTIAAALRPYGVAPGEVERGVRGYQIAELAGIVLPGDAVVEEWAAEALRTAFEHATVVDPADLPEQVDGGWRCGRCKTPTTGTGRCLDCWPASVAPDVLEGRIPTEPSATPDDDPPLVLMGRVMWCAVCNSPVVVVIGPDEQVNTCHPAGALLDSPLFDLPSDLPPGGLNHWSAGMTDEQVAAEVARTAEVPLSTLLTETEAEQVQAAGVDPDSAIVRLSAGAGHDMTPALRAAGLL